MPLKTEYIAQNRRNMNFWISDCEGLAVHLRPAVCCRYARVCCAQPRPLHQYTPLSACSTATLFFHRPVVSTATHLSSPALPSFPLFLHLFFLAGFTNTPLVFSMQHHHHTFLGLYHTQHSLSSTFFFIASQICSPVSPPHFLASSHLSPYTCLIPVSRPAFIYLSLTTRSTPHPLLSTSPTTEFLHLILARQKLRKSGRAGCVSFCKSKNVSQTHPPNSLDKVYV